MPAPIVNPRRSPRLPVSVRVEVDTLGDRFTGETIDAGPSGCQLVAPEEQVVGTQVGLRLQVPGANAAADVTGRVAWCSPTAPWRIGVAFDGSSQVAAARWFERVMRALPGLPPLARVPDRLEPDAPLFLAPPPRFLLDFTPDELDVIRALRTGGTAGDLRLRLGPTWAGAVRALFSLLTRRVVSLKREDAGPVAAWDPVLRAALPPSPGPVLATTLARPRTRSLEAHDAFLTGSQALAAGRAGEALPHFRRALQLAPGDGEIAQAMGKALAASR